MKVDPDGLIGATACEYPSGYCTSGNGDSKSCFFPVKCFIILFKLWIYVGKLYTYNK